MVRSRPTAAHIRATGNATLYRGLTSRKQAVYLRRNLSKVLDRHERQLLRTMNADATREEGLQRDNQLRAWCDTPTQTLRRFVELHHDYRNRPPRIRITRLAIQRQTQDEAFVTQVATPSATPDDNNADSEGSDPDWLAGAEADTTLMPCKGIVSGRSDIIRPQTFSGHLKFADEQWTLQLNQPLMIDVLVSPAQWAASCSDATTDDTGDGASLAIDGKVSLDIKIFTHDKLFGALSVGSSQTLLQTAMKHHIEAQMLKDMSPGAAVLRSTAIEIKPRLSSRYRAKFDNHDTLAMELRLKWEHELSSTLESFYERTADIVGNTGPARCQLPTPARSTHDRTEVEIIYIFQDRTQYTQKSLACPLCDTRHDYKQFQRLHLHLLLHHDHFQVDVEKKDDDRTLRRIVRLDLAERRAGKANIRGNDSLKIDWVAPTTPFDIDAHLDGDTTWVADEDPINQRSSTRIRNKRRPSMKTKSSGSMHRRAPAVESQAKRLPPEEVAELVPRLKKHHPVPSVVDSEGRPITFFRTNSKRPFNTGEMIDNSDDDVDDSWIKERRRQNLAKLVQKDRKLSEAKARFMADWDTHIDFEERHGVSGDTLKREGAIRFAKKYSREMGDKEYQGAWRSKVLRLQNYRIFDQDDVQYCFNLIDGPSLQDEPALPTAAVDDVSRIDDAPVDRESRGDGEMTSDISPTKQALLLAGRRHEKAKVNKPHHTMDAMSDMEDAERARLGCIQH